MKYYNSNIKGSSRLNWILLPQFRGPLVITIMWFIIHADMFTK